MFPGKFGTRTQVFLHKLHQETLYTKMLKQLSKKVAILL